MARKLIPLFAILLASCANTVDPILSERHCIASHTNVVMTAVPRTSCFNGRCTTTTSIMPIIHTVCDRAIDIQYPNPDYRGPKT